jgi:hypothetical protein
MTVSQAVDYAGISRSVLYRLGQEQRVDFRRLGGRSFVTRESVDKMLSNLPKAAFTAKAV